MKELIEIIEEKIEIYKSLLNLAKRLRQEDNIKDYKNCIDAMGDSLEVFIAL